MQNNGAWRPPLNLTHARRTSLTNHFEYMVDCFVFRSLITLAFSAKSRSYWLRGPFGKGFLEQCRGCQKMCRIAPYCGPGSDTRPWNCFRYRECRNHLSQERSASFFHRAPDDVTSEGPKEAPPGSSRVSDTKVIDSVPAVLSFCTISRQIRECMENSRPCRDNLGLLLA